MLYYMSSKKKVKIPVKKGALAGYTLNDKLAVRRKVLSDYAKKKGWSEVVKHLNVLYIYNKNKHPITAMRFKRDLKFIQRTFDPNYNKKRKIASRKHQSLFKRKSKKSKVSLKGGFDKKRAKFPRKMSKSYCLKTSCNKMGFSQKASCRYYKNCYKSKGK